MYGQEIIGNQPARRAPRGDFMQAVQRLKDTLPYRVLKNGDAYTVEICLPTRDGKVITCRGTCSLREAAHELGYTDSDLDTLRAIEASIPAWSEPGAIGAELSREERNKLDLPLARAFLKRSKPNLQLTDAQVLGWWWRMPVNFRGMLRKGWFTGPDLLKTIGHAFRDAAHSKAFRVALGVAGKLASNPAVMSSLGMLTGGAAIPALMAAKSAVDLAHLAVTASNTPEGQAAKKLLKVSSVLAGRAASDAPQPAGAQLQTEGALRGLAVTPSQKARIMELAKVIKAAKARRRIMAPSKVLAVKKENAALNLPAPKLSDVVKYTVALRRTA